MESILKSTFLLHRKTQCLIILSLSRSREREREMGGDVVVVRCGAYFSGPFPTIEGVLAVGGWFGGSVGGDRVVGGSDGHVVGGGG